MPKPNALLSILYSLIATYVEFIIGLIISILVARHLGPQQYGLYGYLMWLSTLLISLVNGGIALGSIKYFAEARSISVASISQHQQGFDIVYLHQYFSNLQFKRVIFFSIVSVAIAYSIGFLKLTSVNLTMIYVVILAAMLKSYQMYYVSVLKGFENFRSLAILSGIISPINLVFVLICIYKRVDLFYYVWLYLAITALYLIVSYILARKNIYKYKFRTNKSLTNKDKNKIFRHVRTASWIAVLSFIVLRQSELFFLNIYSSPDLLAYFNVGFTLANAAMTLVPGVYSMLLMPLMARVNMGCEMQAEQELKTSLRYMLQLIVALIFPVCFFAKEIFVFLYGAQYLQAVFPFQVIIACVAFKTLSDCTNAYLWSKNKQTMMLRLIIVGSIVTILLDFYCIKHFQLMGALFAFSASTLFFIGLNLALVIRKLKSSLEWWIYLRTILSGIFALIIVSPVSTYLPNIYGVIVGGILTVMIYLFLLLITFCLSHADIAELKKFNQRFFKITIFDYFLTLIQNQTAYKA